MIRTLRSCFGLLALATLTTGAALGQLPVSRSGGSISISLPINQNTLMALPLCEVIASGTITGGGSTSTLNVSATLGDVTTNPHMIKIGSHVNQADPSGYGTMARITAATASSVTTGSTALAASVGDKFVITRLETIGSLFGTTNSAGFTGSTGAAGADKIYLDQAGALVGFFYKTGGLGGTGWKLVSAPTGASQENTIIEPGRAIYVSRINAGSTVTLNMTGDAVTGRESPAPVVGFNIMNYPYTLGATLDESGLKDYVTGSTGAAGADLVYLESAGVLTAYFYKTGGLGGTGWKLVSAPTGASQGGVTLQPGKSILFKEQAGTVGFGLNEPFTK